MRAVGLAGPTVVRGDSYPGRGGRRQKHFAGSLPAICSSVRAFADESRPSFRSFLRQTIGAPTTARGNGDATVSDARKS